MLGSVNRRPGPLALAGGARSRIQLQRFPTRVMCSGSETRHAVNDVLVNRIKALADNPPLITTYHELAPLLPQSSIPGWHPSAITSGAGLRPTIVKLNSGTRSRTRGQISAAK